jgi:hypothetical protein
MIVIKNSKALAGRCLEKYLVKLEISAFIQQCMIQKILESDDPYN